MSEYRKISIKKEFADAIEKFINQHKKLGYRSIAQFLEDASRQRLEQLGGLPPILSVIHINIEEGGNDVLLWDSRLGHSVEVRFTEDKVACLECGKTKCYHVRYAVDLPKVQKEFERRRKLGLKVPEVEV